MAAVFRDSRFGGPRFLVDIHYQSRHANGANNNGIVEFKLLLDAQATLHNDTDLGFNVGYNFDLMKIDYDAGLLGAGTIGPLFNTGGTLPLGSVDIYDKTFGLNFADQTVLFSA